MQKMVKKIEGILGVKVYGLVIMLRIAVYNTHITF
jgi:hypothetical protein